MEKLGEIEVLNSTCNISTIKDGRGGIFTWVPEEPILEFNMLYFLAGKSRGDHLHEEFVEYLLVVDGTVAIVTENPNDGSDIAIHANKGTCVRIPQNVPHSFHAITEATCIALITKPWDECEIPVTRND